jgi:phosphoglycolate phosphatase
MLRAVIFDLDGVIVKFNLDSKMIKQDVISYFVKNGMPEGLLSPIQPFSQMRDKVRETFSDMGKNLAFIDELVKNAEKIPIEYEVKAAYHTQLLPNVKDVLLFLKLMGLKLAIFTYNNSEATSITINENGLKGVFNAIVTRDMVTNPKPNRIHLEVVLKELVVAKEDALVVGDSEMDIKPSKDLGVKVVAISSGIRTAEELKAYSPDYLISSISELKEIVKGLE